MVITTWHLQDAPRPVPWTKTNTVEHDLHFRILTAFKLLSNELHMNISKSACRRPL